MKLGRVETLLSVQQGISFYYFVGEGHDLKGINSLVWERFTSQHE